MIALERRGEKRSASTPYTGPQSRMVFRANSSRPTKLTSFECPLCCGTHFISKCFKFQAKAPSERLDSNKQLQLCFNCLKQHRVSDGPLNGRCAVCQKRHHTLLHHGSQGDSQGSKRGSKRGSSGSQSPQGRILSSYFLIVSLHAASNSVIGRRVLLVTAWVQVMGTNGSSTYVRAFLDQGSESSFISESIVQLQRRTKKRACVTLSGPGSTAAETVRARTQLVLRSRVNPNFKLEADALVFQGSLRTFHRIDLVIWIYSNLRVLY